MNETPEEAIAVMRQAAAVKDELVAAKELQQGDLIWYGPHAYEVGKADSAVREGFIVLDLLLGGQLVLLGWVVPQVQAFDRAAEEPRG